MPKAKTIKSAALHFVACYLVTRHKNKMLFGAKIVKQPISKSFPFPLSVVSFLEFGIWNIMVSRGLMLCTKVSIFTFVQTKLKLLCQLSNAIFFVLKFLQGFQIVLYTVQVTANICIHIYGTMFHKSL